MYAGHARFDIVAGQFKRIQRATKAGLGIGDNRGEPVNIAFAFEGLDLVGPLQRAVNATGEFRA